MIVNQTILLVDYFEKSVYAKINFHKDTYVHTDCIFLSKISLAACEFDG